MEYRAKTSGNNRIEKFSIELRKAVYVVTWIVPLTQWLYFAWIEITFSIMEYEAGKYWFPDWFNDYFVIVGFLLTLLCLLIAVISFIQKHSMKNLVPVVLNGLWIGFVVFAVMTRKG